MTDWRSRFEPQSQARPEGPAAPRRDGPDDGEGLDLDLSVYRPWIVQRGRTRPALMLDLRRYEPKAGFWTGWAIAYPHLAAIEYVGDNQLSLDFGPRKFMLEGHGLRELTERLQVGSVIAIQEYCPAVWPHRPDGPFVSAIKRLGQAAGTPPR